MSTTDRPIDLDDLARERSAPGTLRAPRRWLRLAVPAVFLLAFGALFATNLRDLMRGAQSVRFVRPVPVAAGSAKSAPGEVVTQAAGWVEPDPFAVHVAALADGVVREMLVQESDRVAAGDAIARLVDEDALLAKAQAEGMLARARGEEARARAELHAAQASFEAAIEITALLAKAQAELEGRSAAAEQRSQGLVKGRAQVSIAEDELLVQRELEAAGVAGPRQVELAAARVDEARGELALLEADAALAQAEARGAQAELERVRRDAELRIEERRRVADAEATLAVAQGAVAEIKATCDAACLRVERMIVRAPVSGVVLERRATVGTPLIGMDHVVATLYDPTSVRLRVDVPQQDLAKLFVGQRARIESDARSGRPYEGLVQRIVQRADLQKVTLQVHVRVLDADDLLRPEMLMQVRFLAPQAEAGTADTPGTAGGVAIPSRLVVEGGRVWVLDPVQGTAVLRSVKTGSRDGDLVVVSEGLDLSDKLIDSGGAVLREGMHVREVQP